MELFSWSNRKVYSFPPLPSSIFLFSLPFCFKSKWKAKNSTFDVGSSCFVINNGTLVAYQTRQCWVKFFKKIAQINWLKCHSQKSINRKVLLRVFEARCPNSLLLPFYSHLITLYMSNKLTNISIRLTDYVVDSPVFSFTSIPILSLYFDQSRNHFDRTSISVWHLQMIKITTKLSKLNVHTLWQRTWLVALNSSVAC